MQRKSVGGHQRRLHARHRWAMVAAGLGLCVAACRTEGPRILERRESPPAGTQAAANQDPAKRSETEKVQRLIHEARYSGLVFIRNGREHSAGETADYLSARLQRFGGRLASAQTFVREVTPTGLRSAPYQVRLANGETILMQQWLEARLEDIESNRENQDTSNEPRVTIADALYLVEKSELSFVAPQRKAEPKVYSGREFSAMLSMKWRWLGSDIGSLDDFVEQIASESFSTFEPYRVRDKDGNERDFNAWLREELEAFATHRSERISP